MYQRWTKQDREDKRATDHRTDMFLSFITTIAPGPDIQPIS